MNHTPFWRGLLRTVLTLALSLFLLSLLVFVIAHYAPGDPLRAYFGDRVEKMSVDERAWAEAKLGLDRPVLTQYGIWLQNALHGDFGISYKYKMDVLEVIRTRLPYTLRLGGVGFVLLFVLSLGVGVLCARHEDSLLDRILCRVGTVMSCVPEFWLSLVLILLFAVELRWLPSSGAYSVGGDGGFADRAVHLILPVTVNGLIEKTNRIMRYDQSLMEIISDETGAFFAGEKTAEETAKHIQNRVQLYMAE